MDKPVRLISSTAGTYTVVPSDRPSDGLRSLVDTGLVIDGCASGEDERKWRRDVLAVFRWHDGHEKVPHERCPLCQRAAAEEHDAENTPPLRFRG